MSNVGPQAGHAQDTRVRQPRRRASVTEEHGLRLRRGPALRLLAAWLLVTGCATLPTDNQVPRVASAALQHPEATILAQAFAAAQRAHGADSGFRIITTGADGFQVRMQLIRAAQSTLDLQYFIFHGDRTGRLLSGAILDAAQRGVRVRVLVDDAETQQVEDQLTLLEADPRVQIRYFNPFAYRGRLAAWRAIEFVFDWSRLDHRMHNKLLVADNAIVLIGGRNIADAYFQVDPQGQFADDDVFAAGPIVPRLSATFDEFWNNPLSIAVAALDGSETALADLERSRQQLVAERRDHGAPGSGFSERTDGGEPLQSLLAGRSPLEWAHAELVYDSPDKEQVENGARVGRLMRRHLASMTAGLKRELLMITPYVIPGAAGMDLLARLRERDVRVRILTNSLESSTEILAQSGYMRYRQAMVGIGVELYEIRSLIGNIRGSGESAAISRFGNYSLHAKLFVLDRRSVFIGSMNFDQRSLHVNTEIGLLIDSPAIAGQVVTRFEAMTLPENCFQVLAVRDDQGSISGLRWQTVEDGRIVELDQEPARSAWQRIAADLLERVPLDSEL